MAELKIYGIADVESSCCLFYFDVFWFNYLALCLYTLHFIGPHVCYRKVLAASLHLSSAGLYISSANCLTWGFIFFSSFLNAYMRGNRLGKDPCEISFITNKTDNLFLSHFLISKELYGSLFCYLWDSDIPIRNSWWDVPEPLFGKINFILFIPFILSMVAISMKFFWHKCFLYL